MAHKTFRFQVTGSNPFPIDMLRYDRCFPASERDSGLINTTLQYENGGKVTVDLLCITDRGRSWHPQEGRWASFGWTVHPTFSEVV